jgi:hypothetical protein
MATFNTAFGSLPTPGKELFGVAEKPKKTQQPAGQGEQGIAPGSTMNFADMQKNGIARPAPPPAQDAAPPPMLTTLQEQLKEPVVPLPSPQASPAPVPTAAAAPAAAAPVAAPAVAPVAAPPAASATPPAASRPPAGMGEVETPVPNAPTFRAGTTPPPDAPNGSTFTAANGLVWTKRGGLWSYEGGDTDPRIRGYGGLTPIELIGQTNAAASGQGIQKTQVGLGFLETYGIPETEAEWAALAANTGQTVAQLKSMVANDRTRYSTRKEMADFGEQRQWMTENNVKQIP